MMGILDFFAQPGQDDKYASNMAFFNGLAKGNIPGAMLQAGKDAQERKISDLKTEELQMLLQQHRNAAANQAGLKNLQPQFFSPGRPAMGGTADVNAALPPDFRIGAQTPIEARAPQFDVKGYTAEALNKGYMGPLEAIQLQQAAAKDTPINKLDVKDFTPASVARFAKSNNYADLERMDKLHFADTGGGITGLNPFTAAPVGVVQKTGDPFKDLVLGDGAGGVRPNSPLIGAKSSIAKAGASNISVNTEKSLLNEVAGGLGKGITDAKAGAQSALGTIGTVNRLMDALDSGKVMAGPGTKFRQFGLQVGDMLGIAGKDGQEKMLNTRQAIQSLAQLELDGAQQMKGQGQITEAERSIIKRAASGDVDTMTTGELRLLGGVLDRSARAKIRGYNAQVKPLASNPNAAALAPFLNLEEPSARQPSGGGAKFLGFEK